ncbi:MAG: hypothetical protein ACP5Q4_10575 [Candidatus Caldatribacteriaceae bacterium]
MAKLLLVKVGDRPKNALKVQEVLTRYGCNVKTRLGLHEFAPECEGEDEGIILLEVMGKEDEIIRMKEELEKIEKVKTVYVDL